MKILKFLPPVFPFTLYFFTCAPGIGLGDTALLIDQIMQLTINTHVNNHNWTVIFGNLFSKLPFGEIAFRANLMSVFFGGLSVSIFYFVVSKTFQSEIVGLISSSLLAVSNSMWWHSTIIESYAINAFFTVISIYILFLLNETENIKFLYGLFFVAGLALFNHTQMGIISVSATVYLVAVILREFRKRNYFFCFKILLFALLFFIIGFSLFFGFFLRDVMRSGNFLTTLKQASGGDFQSIMFKGTFSGAIADFLYLTIKQFPSLFLIAIVSGTVYLFRNWKILPVISLLTMFLVNTIFFMFYNTWDKFAFLLPSFIILAYFGSFGVNFFVNYLNKKNSIVLYIFSVLTFIFSVVSPPYIYANLSEWGRTYWFWSARYNNNYTFNTHDCAEYIANPNKRKYRDVEVFSNLLFQKLPSNSIYIDDDSRIFYPVNHYYQKYYNKRTDIQTYIINSWGFNSWGLDKNMFSEQLEKAFLENRELYLVSLDFPFNGFIDFAFQKRKYQFEKFYLDSNRYIYRLQNAKDFSEKKMNLNDPIITDMKVGLFFYSNFPIVKSNFQMSDSVMVRLEFFKNSSPFSVRFIWISPDKKIFHEAEAFQVKDGNTNVWNRNKENLPLMKGKWKVIAYVNGNKSIETDFFIGD